MSFVETNPTGFAPTTPSTTSTMVTAANDPAWLGLRLIGWDSAYRTQLARKGYPNTRRYDVSKFLRALTLSDAAGEIAMSMDVEIEDTSDRTNNEHLAALTVGTAFLLEGPAANYYLGGQIRPYHRLFRGRVYSAPRRTSATSLTRSFKAYEAATLFARTEGTMVFLDKTFTEIFNTVCAHYGFHRYFVEDTKVRIGKIVMGPGWTIQRLFQEAATRTYERSGKAYFVRTGPDLNRAVSLLEWGNTGFRWHVVDGRAGTLLDHSFEDSAEDLATRIVIAQEEYDDEGEFRATNHIRQGIVQGDLRAVFGDLVKIVNPDSSLTFAYNENDPDWAKIDKVLQEQMRQMLANHGRTTQRATVRSFYIPGIRTGDRINAGSRVAEDLETGWVVDSVRTTWEATGPTQEIDLVRGPGDSAMGFKR